MKMISSCLSIMCVLVTICLRSFCYSESTQDHIANERIKIACQVQQLPLTTQLFDKCIKVHGAPYNLRQVFEPCSTIAGLNLGSYDGIFNFTCKKQGLNRSKVISCVVENIAKTSTMEIIELSHVVFNIAKECSKIVLKQLIDEANAKAQEAASKAMGNMKMPKIG